MTKEIIEGKIKQAALLLIEACDLMTSDHFDLKNYPEYLGNFEELGSALLETELYSTREEEMMKVKYTQGP